MKHATPELKNGAGIRERLRNQKAVIGTYVPADLFERSSYYSTYRRANRELGNLVDKLNGLNELNGETPNDNIFVFERAIEVLSIDQALAYIVTLGVGFGYDDKRDAGRTFRLILDSGLMLRYNPPFLSKTVQKIEFDDELKYHVRSYGIDTLKWLAGKLKAVNVLEVRGSAGFEYQLSTGLWP
ncbi:hypothetical protein J4443_01620 [Candidatus Woesearchaeota archaeon]|nr:hypothetical protein [Candidatus Woesearchaeota archaeon]